MIKNKLRAILLVLVGVFIGAAIGASTIVLYYYLGYPPIKDTEFVGRVPLKIDTDLIKSVYE